MKVKSFSSSLLMAELRYIQSLHEASALRNPDRLAGRFLPFLRRLRFACLDRESMDTLRSKPFYYYVIARTKHYDAIFLDAVSQEAGLIINVGCGSDTRSYRFGSLLKQHGVEVFECDQPEAIRAKQRMARRLGDHRHVSYVPLDLNDRSWPELERLLAERRIGKALVMMEGVSPYVNFDTFTLFLSFLADMLPAGSRVAYDFKRVGANDGLGLAGRTSNPFRLSVQKEEVAGFHKRLDYRLDRMEESCELSRRLFDGQGRGPARLYNEDALVQLVVARCHPVA